MLIKKLTLSNFKQYKELVIDSFPLGLTGLVGKNGSGKSTLFEAIYYALFGKSLEGSVESLRNDHSNGAPLSVTLEFEDRGVHHRVIRRISGNQNTPAAELQIMEKDIDPPQFKTIAVSASQVSKEIYIRLQIDAESFKNSFFARQKETAGIINGTPKARLDAFRKMLGFDKYEDLETKIGEIIKTTKAEVEILAGFLLGDEVVAEYTQKLVNMNGELGTKNVSLTALINEVEQKNAVKVERNTLLQTLEDKKNRHTSLANSITAKETSISHTQDQLRNIGLEIARLEVLSDEIVTLGPVVGEYNQVTELISQLNEAKNQKTRLDSIIQKRSEATADRDRVAGVIEALRTEIAALPDYALQITTNDTLLAEMKGHFNTLKDSETEVRASIQSISDELKGKKARLNKVQKLDEEGNCPECERPLGEHKPALIERYNNEISVLSLRLEVQEERLTALLAQIAEKKTAIEAQESTIKELQKLASEKEKKNSSVLLYTDQISGFNASIRQAEADIAAIGEVHFDQADLDAAKANLVQVKVRYDDYQRKLGEVEALDSKRNERTTLHDRLAGLNTDLAELTRQQTEVGYNEAELNTAKEAFTRISNEIEQLVTERHSLELAIAELTANIQQISNSLETDRQHRESHRQKSKDVDLYQVYKGVVTGFKARMTQRAIPQVAATADELFTKLTGGRYTGMEITDKLDITVNRDGAIAPLSSLSGGEKDLAAICLRVAISQEIMSNTTRGGKIGFLAFDEVFGAQDEDRRDLLVQALQRLPEQFKQVFVVSHNGDVEAELPNRISIVKRGHFSVIDRIVRNN